MKLLRSLAAGGPSDTVRVAFTVIVLFVLWRGMLFAFDFVGTTMTTQRRPNPNKDYQAFKDNWFWDGWARWDAGWYKRIVDRGYYFEGGQSNVAFFPLYPLVTKAVAKVVRNPWAAGLLVSNASLLLALFFLNGIARMYFDQEGAQRSLVYLLVFPTSFFFSAYYSEALFLLTTATSFYFYLKARYFWCGRFGLLATMTRPTGVALFIAFLLGYLWNKRARPSQMNARILWILLIPCGLLVFMAILWAQVGDPMAFVKGQEGWGRSFTFPLRTLLDEYAHIDFSFPRDLGNTDILMSLITSLLFLVLPLLLLGRCDVSLILYSLLLVLMPLSTGRVLSMMRFEVVAFPAFFALALLGKRQFADRLIVSTLAIFLGLYNLLFFNWYWAG
ncbi:MAG TPA: mannosyltransferase family protein [Vicinamibacteria bacterium]|nr:mannosyltransferase family protein [Vicinamibacteria bacterium]